MFNHLQPLVLCGVILCISSSARGQMTGISGEVVEGLTMGLDDWNLTHPVVGTNQECRSRLLPRSDFVRIATTEGSVVLLACHGSTLSFLNFDDEVDEGVIIELSGPSRGIIDDDIRCDGVLALYRQAGEVFIVSTGRNQLGVADHPSRALMFAPGLSMIPVAPAAVLRASDQRMIEIPVDNWGALWDALLRSHRNALRCFQNEGTGDYNPLLLKPLPERSADYTLVLVISELCVIGLSAVIAVAITKVVTRWKASRVERGYGVVEGMHFSDWMSWDGIKKVLPEIGRTSTILVTTLAGILFLAGLQPVPSTVDVNILAPTELTGEAFLSQITPTLNSAIRGLDVPGLTCNARRVLQSSSDRFTSVGPVCEWVQGDVKVAFGEGSVITYIAPKWAELQLELGVVPWYDTVNERASGDGKTVLIRSVLVEFAANSTTFTEVSVNTAPPLILLRPVSASYIVNVKVERQLAYFIAIEVGFYGLNTWEPDTAVGAAALMLETLYGIALTTDSLVKRAGVREVVGVTLSPLFFTALALFLAAILGIAVSWMYFGKASIPFPEKASQWYELGKRDAQNDGAPPISPLDGAPLLVCISQSASGSQHFGARGEDPVPLKKENNDSASIIDACGGQLDNSNITSRKGYSHHLGARGEDPVSRKKENNDSTSILDACGRSLDDSSRTSRNGSSDQIGARCRVVPSNESDDDSGWSC